VDDAGKEWHLTKPQVMCGRAAENDLIVLDDSVSRQHARFDLGPDGYSLADVASRNGTYLNDERLSDTPRLLHDGDRVALGAYQFTYHAPSDSAVNPTVLRAYPTEELDSSPRTQVLLAAVPEFVPGPVPYARIPARGILNAGTIEVFLDACRVAVGQGAVHLVIDASELEFIDSGGIGGLVRLQRELAQLNGSVSIVAPQPSVRHALELLHLDAVLPRFPDEASAIARFMPPPVPVTPARTGTPQLVLPGGQTWPLTGAAVSIGKDVGNDILLDSPGVASHHAKIVRVRGRHVLLDLPQSGGTSVEGKRIEDLHVLHDGESFEVGDKVFQFFGAEPETASGAVAAGDEANTSGTDRAVGVLLFRELPLTEKVLTVGRAPENALVVDDPRVSGLHAKIIRIGDDYWLLDLGSSNGTFVNEQRVSDVHLLRDGDSIAFGASIITFAQRHLHLAAEEPEPEGPPPFVFADSSGRRWVRVRIFAALLLLLLIVIAVLFFRLVLQL
jgi:anti-anti-sigma factor